jgi:tRNA (mo5U34)-methyltransferase
MIDYQPLIKQWADGPLAPWAHQLQEQIDSRFNSGRYGDLPRWLSVLERLPTDLTTDLIELNQAAVTAGNKIKAAPEKILQLEELLRELHPWRKGPFHIHGVDIDTEWKSDLKWQRLITDIRPLSGKRVLDIGCGSGYHVWRMLGEGAAEVIGVDPTPLFVVQFWALQHFIQNFNAWVLPLGIEHLPEKLRAFDTVFSMGVLYHRRSPLDHLLELREALVPGGQLVLETLVIDGPEGKVLVPEDRYARMGNVWFLPSCATLEAWLKKMKFQNIELIDISTTSSNEQRSTEWMTYHSLSNFLDPSDSSKTIEGYPAPQRAVITATAP